MKKEDFKIRDTICYSDSRFFIITRFKPCRWLCNDGKLRTNGGFSSLEIDRLFYFESEKEAEKTLNEFLEEIKMKNIEINVKVNGKDVPLSTISTETFERIKGKEERYIFKAGDIVKNNCGKRIIVRKNFCNQLIAVDFGGKLQCENEELFYTVCEYKKIGELSDFIH